VRPSPLFPGVRDAAEGQAQFNWTPTTDLTCAGQYFLYLGRNRSSVLLSVAPPFWFTSPTRRRQSPKGHAIAQLALFSAIAQAKCGFVYWLPFTNSKMDARCTSCHNTDAFVATVIKPQCRGGIGCVKLSREHRVSA